MQVIQLIDIYFIHELGRKHVSHQTRKKACKSSNQQANMEMEAVELRSEAEQVNE